MKGFNKNLQFNIFLLFVFFSLSCFAQIGKDGDPSSASGIINKTAYLLRSSKIY